MWPFLLPVSLCWSQQRNTVTFKARIPVIPVGTRQHCLHESGFTALLQGVLPHVVSVHVRRCLLDAKASYFFCSSAWEDILGLRVCVTVLLAGEEKEEEGCGRDDSVRVQDRVDIYGPRSGSACCGLGGLPQARTKPQGPTGSPFRL